MVRLADAGASPNVVDDQFGRLTFTSEISRAIRHLVETPAPYGTYNVTCSGPLQSWVDIARDVFELRGRSRADANSTTTAQYAAGKVIAPRPAHSGLDLSRLEATGFVPRSANELLIEYIGRLDPA
jgi:dTDP-4-dehydrorhamnose 3,5-epimerase